MLTGGEVFTEKKLLYHTIISLRQRKFIQKPKISVQTNGFWARDKDIMQRRLDELVDLGVIYVEVSAADIYHRRAGLDMSIPRNLALELKKRNFGYKRKYIPHHRVFPAGRAWYMDPKYFGSPWFHQCEGLDQIGISSEGMAHPCTLMIKGTEIGDAKKTKMKKIMAAAKKRDMIRCLMREDGPMILAKKQGIDEVQIEEILKATNSNSCGLCSYIFHYKVGDTPLL